MMVLLFCNHRINSVLRTHKPPQHFLKLFIGYTSYQVWYSWINDAFDSDFLNRRSSHYTIGQPTISQKNVGPHTSFALHINISRSDRTVSNWYSIIDFTHILNPTSKLVHTYSKYNLPIIIYVFYYKLTKQRRFRAMLSNSHNLLPKT